MKLIMQGQGVIAVTPIIANAAVLIDDQRVDAKLGQAGRNRQPGLPATNDQNRRVAVIILLGHDALVQPVWSAKIA